MNLKQKKWLLVLVMFFCVVFANAQKVRVPKEKDDAPPPPAAKQKKSGEKAKDTAKYVALVEIDESSKIKVVFEDPYFLESYSDTSGWVENLFSNLSQKSPTKKPNFSEIIIKPKPTLKYGKVVDLIKKIRNISSQNIKVEVSDELLAVISKPLPKIPRPNPLFLLVRLDDSGKISLNNEETGSINSLTPLKDFLRKIFKERAEYGAFREGTNEVETTVFIEVPLSANFVDVIKIAEALREAGATPIGLQIDEFVRTTQIQEIKNK